MPIYEYRCLACGSQVEVIHGIAAQGPAECAACGGAMRKALTAPAIHFRGSGWAKKDARAAASAASSSKATEGGTGSDAKGAGSEAMDSSTSSEPGKAGAGAGGEKTSTATAKAAGTGSSD